MSFSTLKLLFLAIAMTILLFVTISQCFILKKAGKHWWFGLIPILAEVEMFGISWKKRYAIPYLLGELYIEFFTALCQFILKNPKMVTGVINTTVLTATLITISIFYVVAIQMSVRLAAKFGQKEGFGIGLAIIPFIFYPILAFGPAKYSHNDTDDLSKNKK